MKGSRKVVRALKDETRSWSFDQLALKMLTGNFYKDLYFVYHSVRPLCQTMSSFPRLDKYGESFLSTFFTSKEVKCPIFEMGAIKAPSPDVFHGLLPEILECGW